MLVNILHNCIRSICLAYPKVTIYLTDNAFSAKAKRFNKMFTSILALFFLQKIANKSHFYAPRFLLIFFCQL